MDASRDAAARDAMMYAQAGDPESMFYKGAMQVLFECEAADRRANANRKHVTIPFHISEAEVLQLEEQFSVGIRLRGLHNRARLTPRVSAMVHCLDSMLVEMGGGGGRRVLQVDGDIATVVAMGIEDRLVERTYATSRLAFGYFAEDEAVRAVAMVKGGEFARAANVMLRELQEGGGEHFWPVVREDGPAVEVVLVNHFKTPVGPQQVAWLAECRGASALGCFPFQLEMLTASEGRLACFPGKFYVDVERDVVTLVPDSDASMSVSHPYSSLMDIVKRNAVVVGGSEYLCEKFLTVRGVLFYTLRRVDGDFKAPEVLRSSFYDPVAAKITEITYPYVKQSPGGVVTGWELRKVKLLTSRFERVVNRCRCISTSVVSPADVYSALVDYNNVVVNSLDTTLLADRMRARDEEEVALAIALWMNFRRHEMKGTFSVLLDALRKRHAVKDIPPTDLLAYAMVAMSAWWGKPQLGVACETGELPVAQIVDWCGNDFSVVLSENPAWVDFEEEVGKSGYTPYRRFSYMPYPKFDKGDPWYEGIVRVAAGCLKASKEALSRNPTTKLLSVARTCTTAVGDVTEKLFHGRSVVGEFTQQQRDPSMVLSTLKKRLVKDLARKQGAVNEASPLREPLVRDEGRHVVKPDIPVVWVSDPVAIVGSELEEINGGPMERDAVSTGYRIAEVDLDINLEGGLQIKDNRRLIPKERYVRRPKVDAGVEGARVASHAGVFAALKKRNLGIPANRGAVDLDTFPDLVVDRFIAVCFREDWAQVLEKHLETGMWEFNLPDIEQYMEVIDERKAEMLLDSFFSEGEVDLTRWLLIAKGKVKASRESEALLEVNHAQTILYLENGAINAAYSAMTKRFKKCFDEMLRPNVQVNAQFNLQEHEDWYNSLNSERASRVATTSYSVDAKSYDRSQENVGLKAELRFYARTGLNKERLDVWRQTHGSKKAVSLMFGLVLTMALGGVSGIWKTLLRNGLIMAFSVVYSSAVTRQALVMLDVKGDDVDMEVDGPLDVNGTVEHMGLAFNLSAKFFTNNVRYFCKQFRIWMWGRWWFVADPWARIQSVATPVVMGNSADALAMRWESVRPDLIHYDNGALVDAAAEAAQQYYGLQVVPYGCARSLARFCVDRASYYNFFGPVERVD